MREKKSAVTFERVIAIGFMVLGLGGAGAMLQGHEKRITNMESREDANRTLLMDMKGDIKVLVERTDPNRKH